ncbi:SH3 domain-containing protein [Helicobacter sp. MIT 14-3879]|uniref:SH3 domain-containing protein n=1 Tax=Helicobacter sp. MIT 14-3879 TaxID=2040649 RepID=UPI000E1ECB82|nr:SH3 domain-containing protein [Helicobacter sp. MIT 14-3879]RDU62093.1 hypothetical protein CQA44_07620 [Helicobacter sp. MIT 14-3879]
MLKIKFIVILLIVIFAYADENQPKDESQPKLVYIKQEILKDAIPNELNYIGEIIAIKYNIIVLDNALVRSISFLEEKGVEIKNQNSNWNELEDGTFENTFYFKIKSGSFAIPRLEVIVENDNFKDIAISEVISYKAINLYTNHQKYAGVVAKRFDIKNYSVKPYNEKNNIIILDMYAEYSNLEDFRFNALPKAKQGFESSNFNIDNSSGIYYIILPNDEAYLEFEYFDLQAQTYKLSKVKNVVNKKQININQEIKPINKVLIFKNIVILAFIFIVLIVFFIRKIPFKIRLFLLIIAIFLIFYLIISINSKWSGILTSNSYIRILPTSNSTIIAKTSNNTEVQIVSKYGDYYKVSIIGNENKTGWVEKNSVK